MCSGSHVAGQRALGEHRVDVEAVAGRRHQQAARCRARRRRGPASSSRTARPGRRRRAGSCRRGRRCAPAVSPAVTVGEAGRPARRLVEVRPVRAASAGRGPSRRGSPRTPRRRRRAASAGGVSVCGDQLEGVQAGVELGAPPRPPGLLPVDVLQGRAAPTSSSWIHSSRGAGSAAGQAAAACGPPRGRRRRTAAAPSCWPPSRSAGAVRAGEHGREARA